MPDLLWWQWLLGTAAAFSVGVSKTGVPGLAILVVPMMVLTAGDARESAGWLLPILCMADVFAVIYWRRHAAASRLFSLAPWVFAGLIAGSAALSLSEGPIRVVVGVIIAVMLLLYVKRRFAPAAEDSHASPALYGMAAGFATTVANAAGPVMNLYLLSKRLPQEEFVATGAWFFFIINLVKVPVYLWHGLFSVRSLAFDAVMFPAVLGGALTGRWLIYRLPARVFEILVVGLTALSLWALFH